MSTVKPFKGLRPRKDIAARLSCLPYDVMNTQEAMKMAEGNPYSFLHITRAEIDLPEGIDPHSKQVYDKSLNTFHDFQKQGWLIQDDAPKFYIYAQTMDGRTQYGIAGAAFCEDYQNGIIKKHELTRPDKEDDRMVHVNTLDANAEPVFLSYRAVPEIDRIVADIVKNQEPEYDFTSADGFGHKFWVINDAETNKRIEKLFAEKVPALYVADGHHRTAAAARVGLERKAKNPAHTGAEEYNYFLAVIFPDSQLKIMDYNRVIKDLNGNTESEFLDKLSSPFEVKDKGTEIHAPEKLHQMSLYMGGHWYSLDAKPGTYDDSDPIGVLDVTILTKQVLDPILGITDLRTSKRIDFVGGIRGLGELKRRVDSGEMKCAFAMYPVSMSQLLDIADTGNIMPPKTTWFEPKLRSGLVVHTLKY
ncbi:MAG: DUF1015 domain-containing protein [Bacteroidales bacterium]|nr:DUF1015 domain-containing protein [Bacteroidales bacterium]